MTSEIPKTVYFAGKVSKGGGYRGILFGNNRVMSNGEKTYSIGGGKVVYGGPSALSCDHGCFHSTPHGFTSERFQDYGHGNYGWEPICCGGEDATGYFPDASLRDGGLSRDIAVRRCFIQISMCDAVHAYLDSTTCFGTLVELGYAAGMRKPIHLVCTDKFQGDPKTSELWFAYNLPTVQDIIIGNETSISPSLLVFPLTHKEKYRAYLKSEQWKKLRKQKLKESEYRCQLCNSNGKINVHHRTYERVFNELPSDLIALCQPCHEKFHGVD